MQEARCPYDHPDRPGVCDALLFKYKEEAEGQIQILCRRCGLMVTKDFGPITSFSGITQVDKAVVLS